MYGWFITGEMANFSAHQLFEVQNCQQTIVPVSRGIDFHVRKEFFMKLTSSVILIVLLNCTPLLADSPIVSNIIAAQRETAGVLTKLVDITYDVENPDGGLVFIRLQVSNDRGATFTVPATAVSGDVGASITPGIGKNMVWDKNMG